jgi:hypothetical protein
MRDSWVRAEGRLYRLRGQEKTVSFLLNLKEKLNSTNDSNFGNKERNWKKVAGVWLFPERLSWRIWFGHVPNIRVVVGRSRSEGSGRVRDCGTQVRDRDGRM